MPEFFALDDYYDSDRLSYYRALQSVDQMTLDLTQWLESFTYGVALQIAKVKKRVVSLSRDSKRIQEKNNRARSTFLSFGNPLGLSLHSLTFGTCHRDK